MARSSYVGYLRQYGGASKRSGTPAVLFSCIQFTFDATQSTTGVGKFLPVGSIPVAVQDINGQATGTSPTVHIGFSGAQTALALNLDANQITGFTHTGGQLGIELTADTEIFAGEGSSSPSGGTVTAGVYYLMADDGGA